MINTLDILKGQVPDLKSHDELRTLWFVVYDGPVAWGGRDAFEEIAYQRARADKLAEELKCLKRP